MSKNIFIIILLLSIINYTSTQNKEEINDKENIDEEEENKDNNDTYYDDDKEYNDYIDSFNYTNVIYYDDTNYTSILIIVSNIYRHLSKQLIIVTKKKFKRILSVLMLIKAQMLLKN